MIQFSQIEPVLAKRSIITCSRNLRASIDHVFSTFKVDECSSNFYLGNDFLKEKS